MTLEAIAEAVIGCRACQRLVQYREQVARDRVRRHAAETYWGRPIPAFGDADARLLVVGLAPAAHGANRTGRPFTGDLGDGSSEWVARGLHAIGLANQPTSRSADDGLVLRGALLTGAVRCAPPGNRPTGAELARCRPFLEAELAALPELRVILALGRVAFGAVLAAWEAVTGETASRPAFAHGAECRLPSGPSGRAVWLVASYHPSRQNTNTGRLTPEAWSAVFRRVAARLAEAGEERGGKRRGPPAPRPAGRLRGGRGR